MDFIENMNLMKLASTMFTLFLSSQNKLPENILRPGILAHLAH